METSAETAFMTKVYDAQQQWSIANKTFTAGLPGKELLEIEGIALFVDTDQRQASISELLLFPLRAHCGGVE
jgi:hypothetical protein